MTEAAALSSSVCSCLQQLSVTRWGMKNVTGEGLHEYNKHGQDPKVSVKL